MALVGAFGTLVTAIDYLLEHQADRWRYLHVLPLLFAFATTLSYLGSLLRGRSPGNDL
jgi:hypothetical protein